MESVELETAAINILDEKIENSLTSTHSEAVVGMQETIFSLVSKIVAIKSELVKTSNALALREKDLAIMIRDKRQLERRAQWKGGKL